MSANIADELFSQEWEYDFSWPPKVPPPDMMEEGRERFKRAGRIISFTSCDNCNVTMPQMLAIVIRRHTDSEDTELHFCSDHCHGEYYMDVLRRAGI